MMSSQVFMISLARRPERRNRMLACLDELAFNYTLFDAVDGRCGMHECVLYTCVCVCVYVYVHDVCMHSVHDVWVGLM